MKAQMRFQKYLCIVMLVVGALATLYAFFYCTGSLSDLAKMLDNKGNSLFSATSGKYDAKFYNDIQGFNSALMYCGIVMILLSVSLFVTACHSRRNYYVSNIVSVSVCAGGNFIISLALLVMNGIWRGRFLSVDFTAWDKFWTDWLQIEPGATVIYSESTAMFDLGFAVYIIVMLVSVLLILNLIWKIKLMQGEKKLLANGGVTEVQAA